jgi:hypothetical protein
MTSKINLIFALQQVENIGNLVRENNYEAFFTSHLLPLKYEIERQLILQNNGKTTN